MASPVTKASVLTTLRIGRVEMAVGLFSAHSDPKKKLVEFDRAGPHGGVLKVEQRARPVPVVETVELPDSPVVRHDVLEDAPAMDAPVPEPDDFNRIAAEAGWTPPPLPAGGPVEGEYGRVLIEEGSGVEVAPDAVRRGVRLEDGRFIDCTEHLAKIEEDTKLERMDVVGFLDSTRISRARITRTYYIGAADEQAPKPMRLIYEALRARRRLALVKLTKRSRQSLGAIGVLGECLVMHELVWAEDFRRPPAKALTLQKATVSEDEVRMACALIDSMAVGMDALDELRDDAIERREALYAQALAGQVPEVLVPEREPEPDDVMAQLEASLAAVQS